MTVSEIVNFIIENIAVVGSGIGILGGFYKWLHSMFKEVKEIKKLFLKIEPAIQELEVVKKELKPNGGTSLKDAINRIESKVSSLEFAQHLSWDFTAKVAMFKSDAAGRCVWVNKNYLDLVKKQAGEIMGYGWESSISLQDRDRVTEEWYESCARSRPFDMSYAMVDADQTEFKVRCQARGDEKMGHIGFIYVID